jgi:glyoxylase-like metal-dependent hydrolase (beta-lactamase superfamily II)
LNFRKILAGAALLAALTATATASAQGRGGRGGASPFGNFELKIEQVEDGLYMIQSSASGNITVFESDDSVLLVDSKFEREHERYMELLRTVTDKPVRYVVNTHMHGDHTGGNILLEELGSDIVATENARRRLAQTQATGLPNITFDDHMRLYFGDWVMDFYWFGRGHTDGDLVIHLPEEGLVLSGDLFAGGDPFVRLIDYNGGGSLAEWSGTLEKVLALDFDRVIPGHSEVTDRARMQAYLDEIVRMQDLISEMHDAGRSPEDIQSAVTGEFGAMAFVVLPGIQGVIAELE